MATKSLLPMAPAGAKDCCGRRMMWAVFKGDKQVTKAHPHLVSVVIEAIQKGYVILLRRRLCYVDGYTAREVKDPGERS